MTSDSRDQLLPLYALLYEATVRRTLEEDLGLAGDLTTDAIIDKGARAKGSIVARSAGRIADTCWRRFDGAWTCRSRAVWSQRR